VAFSIALDLLVAGLLLVTICYAMVLNKKIGTLRRDKAELQKMAATFNAATIKADKSIKKLRGTAEDLGASIEKANSLRDDLMFLTERGSSAADKLEALVRKARDEAQSTNEKRGNKFSASDLAASNDGVTDFPKRPAASKNSDAATRRPPVVTRSDAERELIQALQLAR